MSGASNPAPVLWVRTAAGPGIGFGHLRRCFVLAGILQDYCLPLFLLDCDNSLTGREIIKQGLDFDCSGLESVWERLPLPAGILIDTRLTEGLNAFIATARSRAIPIISIHDLGLSPVASDIAIDGSAVPVKRNDFPLSDRVFGGTDFMVLDPAYGALNQRRKPIREQIRTVFINLGGGDSSRYFPAILEGLKSWQRELEVIGVPGFVSWGQEALGGQDWHPLRFRWESENIEDLLFNADVAITAGGLSAYEALCAGTPLAALSYDELQQHTISTLAGKGACIDLGPGAALDPVFLSKTIASLNLDIAKRTSLSASGRDLVDGLGAERVARIIRQTIHRDSAEMSRRADVSRAGF
jgi:spore coat polysaccharide biosynthesis predicted glycosyltransferase SpsG